MKKKKLTIKDLTKESPTAHKKRASSGIKFRAVQFEDKKRRLKEKYKLDFNEEE